VFPGEAFPECGFSFERFVFGRHFAQTSFSDEAISSDEDIITESLEFRYCSPRHVLYVQVPHAWIFRWFLKATWLGTNFADMHERGELYAPTAHRQVEHFVICRFCSERDQYYDEQYVNDFYVKARGATNQPSATTTRRALRCHTQATLHVCWEPI